VGQFVQILAICCTWPEDQVPLRSPSPLGTFACKKQNVKAWHLYVIYVPNLYFRVIVILLVHINYKLLNYISYNIYNIACYEWNNLPLPFIITTINISRSRKGILQCSTHIFHMHSLLFCIPHWLCTHLFQAQIYCSKANHTINTLHRVRNVLSLLPVKYSSHWKICLKS